MSESEITTLQQLATQNGDTQLVALMSKLRTPSGVTTVKHQYAALSSEDQSHIYGVLMTILQVGLYLAGWNGPSEPWIRERKAIRDVVRMDLAIDPLIRSLHRNQHFAVVKDFPITTYDGSVCPVKPSKPCTTGTQGPVLAGAGTTLDECLNTVLSDTHRDYHQLSTNLITSAYYYITTVCSVPVPMVEPLMRTL